MLEYSICNNLTHSTCPTQVSRAGLTMGSTSSAQDLRIGYSSTEKQERPFLLCHFHSHSFGQNQRMTPLNCVGARKCIYSSVYRKKENETGMVLTPVGK